MEMKVDDHTADNLISGYLESELSEAEIRDLISWIKQDKKNKRYFDECCEVWITTGAVSEYPGYDYQKGFRKFRQVVAVEKTLPVRMNKAEFLKNTLKYAAIFLTGLITGAILFYRNEKENLSETGSLFSELVVPLGSKAVFSMNDGTVVTLNAGSRLKYDNQFGVADRVVHLEGEGYFKVARDTNNPFIVRTPYLSITALGTEFNVKAYSADSTVEATLVNGKVKVDPFGSIEKHEITILKPSQKLTYYKKTYHLVAEDTERDEKNRDKIKPSVVQKTIAGPRIVRENVNVEPVVSWKENRWIFEQQTLAQIATDLERKFDVRIVFNSERLKTWRFTGTIIAEPIEQVLEFMSITAPIDFRLKGRVVTLSCNNKSEELSKSLYDRHD
jgi:ferric-dicitrate binding protein FerR (iron transport regulator)